MKNYFNLKKSKLLLLTLLTMLVVGARPAWAQNMEPTVACPAPTNLAVTAESITAREATVTWEGTSDSYVVMIGEENLAVSADFETGDLSQAGFTSSSDYPWTVVANTHSGAYCAKSGGDDSSTSYLNLEVNLTADMTLTFSAKVSSESNYDKAYFDIDGVNKINGISGNGNWIDYSYPLTAGTHTLSWRYTKDGNGNFNDDCFYVDDIVVSAGVDSWTEYNTNAQTYTFTNLTPNRHYQVKVKGNCGDEGYSQETAPVGFTTLALDAVPFDLQTADVTATTATLNWEGVQDSYNVRYRKLVFFDDFENGLGNWTTYTMGDADAWETGDPSSFGGSGHNSSTNVALSMSWNNIAYTADNWLVTPQVQLGGTLKFYVYTNQEYPDDYEVKLSTGGNTISDFTVTLQELASIPTTGDWVEVNIDLSSYEGQSGYIAIHHSYYDGNYILVDDFSIYPPQEAGEWIEATSTTNSLDITGLTADTTYEFQVQGVYGEDGESNWSASATFTTSLEVTLTDGQAITDLTTYAGKDVWVNYTRSFTEGTASTVCLPFAYKKKEGDGSFYAFTNIEKVGNEYVATMTDPGVSTLTANTPYLYLPNATGDVDFGGAYTIPDPLTAGETTSNGWTFKGTYSTIEWTDAPAEPTYGFSAQDADGISQGQFVKVGSYVRIKPMRAYLEYNGSDSQFANARSLTRAAATTSDDTLPETIGVRLISANGEVNAIGTLYTRTGEVSFDSEAWYTLDGKRLNAKPNTKGIYVNNGKKVVIK